MVMYTFEKSLFEVHTYIVHEYILSIIFCSSNFCDFWCIDIFCCIEHNTITFSLQYDAMYTKKRILLA